MPEVSVQRVRVASDALVEDAVTLMIEAMEGDPCMHALCGGDASVHHHLARAMIQEGIRWGEFWVAEEDAQLVGFMTWVPPGVEATIPKEERAKVNAPYFEALSEEAKAYSRGFFSTEFPAFLAQCLGSTGKQDGWWLRNAMVRRGKQGKGIGRKLFEPIRKKAAECGEHIAVSTTAHRNVAIYKALGFELRGFREMHSPWGDWPCYVLYQRPRLVS